MLLFRWDMYVYMCCVYVCLLLEHLHFYQGHFTILAKLTMFPRYQRNFVHNIVCSALGDACVWLYGAAACGSVARLNYCLGLASQASQLSNQLNVSLKTSQLLDDYICCINKVVLIMLNSKHEKVNLHFST